MEDDSIHMCCQHIQNQRAAQNKPNAVFSIDRLMFDSYIITFIVYVFRMSMISRIMILEDKNMTSIDNIKDFKYFKYDEKYREEIF